MKHKLWGKVLAVGCALSMIATSGVSAFAATPTDGDLVTGDIRRTKEYQELPESAQNILDKLCDVEDGQWLIQNASDLIHQQETYWEADASIRDETKAECAKFAQEQYTLTNSQGNKIMATLYTPDQPSDVYVFLCHGYNMEGLDEWSRVIPEYINRGYNVLVPEHQGGKKGLSEGFWVGFGSQESVDSVQWLNWVLKEKDPDAKFILEGVSMGAATVLLMTAQPNCPNDHICFIVEDCGYTSIRDEVDWIVKKYAPDVPDSVRPKVVDLVAKFYKQLTGFDPDATDAKAAAAKSDIPLLIMHGTRDVFVPTYMGTEIYEASASKDKQIVYYDNVSHAMAQFRYPTEYFNYIDQYIAKYVTE